MDLGIDVKIYKLLYKSKGVKEKSCLENIIVTELFQLSYTYNFCVFYDANIALLRSSLLVAT